MNRGIIGLFYWGVKGKDKRKAYGTRRRVQGKDLVQTPEDRRLKIGIL